MQLHNIQTHSLAISGVKPFKTLIYFYSSIVPKFMSIQLFFVALKSSK
jgi:hypothetical protein